MIVVEGGGSFGTRRPATGAELEQRRIKARLIAESWMLGGIDAVALGEADWGLGAEFVRGLVVETGLPVLAANLTCDGTGFPASKVVRGPAGNVGLVAVTVGPVEGCTVSEPAPALREAVAGLGRNVDMVIGLLPLDDDRSVRGLLEGDLGLDLVIDARGRAITAPPEKIEDTWTVGAGNRARQVGVLTLHLESGAEGWAPEGVADQMKEKVETLRKRVAQQNERLAGPIELDPKTRLRLEQQRDGTVDQIATIETQLAELAGARTHRFATRAIELSDAVADHAATEALVVAAKQRVTQSAGADPTKFVPRVVPEGAFAGGETCVGCHPAEHAQWSQTGHARAWSSLVTEDRAFDSDCWTCHVTGAGQPDGPPSATSSGAWRDVQCEACHGPSRAHASSPATADSLRDPPLPTCTACHDGEQDGGRFDPASYLPRVRH